MRRYLRLYLYFMRFAFSRALEFRFDWWTRIFMDLIYYATNIAFFKVIYLHTATIAGWDESQAIIFIATYLVIDAIQMAVMAGNMFMMTMFINDGSLDYYLMRPVSSMFFLTLREFSASSSVNLIMALGILGWAVSNYTSPFSLLDVALLLAFILVGFIIYYSLRVIWSCQGFWTEANTATDQIFYSVVNLAERPDRIYRGWVRFILITILPFALIASFPARIFFGEDRLLTMAHMLIVAVISFATLLFVWSKSVRAYGSASS